MGEKEDKEKAEKLAAAKKRVAALQKKKKAAAGGEKSGEKSGGKGKAKKNDTTKDDEHETADVDADADADGPVDEKEGKPDDDAEAAAEPAGVDVDEADFNNAIAAATAAATSSPPQETVESPAIISPPGLEQDASGTRLPRHSARQPSVSIQSKLRSTSFRDNAGPLSPASGLTRLEELERENKRLAKEAEEHETRWRKVEEELEELREEKAEKSGSPSGAAESEIKKLRAEIEALKRRRASTTRRESTVGGDDAEHLKAELEGKDASIADMQLEISRLRSQLSNQTQGCETHGEQISALQASVSEKEKRLKNVETELADAKKALMKASEKAMLDGTERTSTNVKILGLERDLIEAQSQVAMADRKAEQLEKKVEAMTKLHREGEARNAGKLAAAETTARELPELRAKLDSLEKDNARLREKHKRVMSGSGGDEGLDELEDEERQKLERRIRELEGQVFDLQRGVWRDKRIQMQPSGDGGSRTSLDPGEDFDDVDLSGSGAASRRRSMANPQGQQQRHSNFAQVFNSGLAAFRGSPDITQTQTQTQGRARNDSLLQEFDDDDDTFDEGAFAHAQQEEEARKMVEHVREVKKGLSQWKGWRLDLVDARRIDGGNGFGEIFDV